MVLAGFAVARSRSSLLLLFLLGVFGCCCHHTPNRTKPFQFYKLTHDYTMAGVHRDAIQKQIHQDWANREYIEVITASIKRITDFLNSFGTFALRLL